MLFSISRNRHIFPATGIDFVVFQFHNIKGFFLRKSNNSSPTASYLRETAALRSDRALLRRVMRLRRRFGMSRVREGVNIDRESCALAEER